VTFVTTNGRATLTDISSRDFAPPIGQTVRDFVKDIGDPYIEYGKLEQLLLVPSLIAARGRLLSIKQWRCQDRVLGHVDCCFLHSEKMEALTGRPDNYAIYACDGLAYGLIDLMSLCLSMPTVLKEIGNSGLEDIERVYVRTKPAGYGFFRQSEDSPIDFSKDITAPKCSTRSLAALYLTGISLDLVFCHEMAHVMYGHVDFVASTLGVRALFEQPKGDSDLRLMVLEAEADRYGMMAAIEAAVRPNSPYLPFALRQLSIWTRVKAVFVTAALLTWFWAFHQKIDREINHFDPYASGSHPPPLARLHLTFKAGRLALERLGWSREHANRVSLEAMEELEEIGKAKKWFEILLPDRSFGLKAMEFVDTVNKIANDLIPDVNQAIEKFRFFPP